LLVAKEKAEESDRLKTAFLQNMSHEIRTPMNAIMGFSELISLQYNNKEKVEKYSKIINQRCNDLLCLIDDILDIARIESGQLSINPQSTNLSKLCNEIYQLFKEHQKKINKENIQLKKEPNFKYKNIIIDDVKLKQIFINLVNNAFKFTKEGVVTFGCKNYSDNEILFYVSDTGIGIPKDKFDYIFERFTQLEVGLSKQYGGTGLGLSIVKGLVKLLGGKIWLESELGKGTTFYFTIPFSIDEEEKAKTEKSEDKPIQFNQCLNYTILIVEDDYYNSVYLKELLEDYGFKTISTEYGEEAIKIINNQEVDMILMDIRLPDIDGYETTRRIRKQYPKLKIIAQTAYAMPEDRNKALEAGCNDFVTKPIDPGQLFEKIKTSLEI